MEWTCFFTLSAANTQLFIHHVDAGLGILSDSTFRTCLSALTALDTDHGFGRAFPVDNLDAGLVRMKFLVKCLGAGGDALQAGPYR